MVLVKLNNKGRSLVELIMTFSVFTIIIIGVYNLVLESKETLKNKEIVKNITDFSNYKNDQIHYDLITNKPFAFVLKKESDDKFGCNSSNYCSVTKNSVKINYNNKIKEIGLGLLEKDYCKNIYPCLVYFYSDKSEIGMVTVAFNSNKDSKLGPGILYGKEKEVSFKKLPNSNEVIMDKKIYMDYKNDLLVLNFPYYLGSNNYGFKIVYPIEVTNKE